MKIKLTIFLIIWTSMAFSQNLTIEDYTKTEKYITMRDGVKLYTVIYKPKDLSKDYPILMKRTPYSCSPYGKSKFPKEIIHNNFLVKSGYIFVIQDMRGRFMSEGVFENVKPIYSHDDKSKTDETTDTWDTVEWLIKNEANNNGKVGVLGNSYLGWTSLQAAISGHPAIKAVEAAAPVTDFYFEDFQRYGLLTLGYMPVYDAFGIHKEGYKTTKWWGKNKSFYGDTALTVNVDYYDYFLGLGPLKNVNNYIRPDNFFWKEIKGHPHYDDFHKKRSLLPQLKNIDCAVMIVGGWHDEQNLYGIINAYKTIEKNNPKIKNTWVMGPWAHGHQKSLSKDYYLGEIFFGEDVSMDFQVDIEFDYFEHYLKGVKSVNNFETRLFDTGLNKWTNFDVYPKSKRTPLYLNKNNHLTPQPNLSSQLKFEYISDPANPVPHIEEDYFYNIPPKFAMTDDQRFASKRPDVLTFTTAALAEDLTLLGEIEAQLKFMTNKTGADLIVKLIDVYSRSRLVVATDKKDAKMNGYQRLIRTGYIRGKYRNGFETPEAFISNKVTDVNVQLLDVFHTFKKGHKIMIQIQSSLFPMFDRNPQTYMPDYYNAKESDFVKANHIVTSSSRIVLPIMIK